MDLVDLVDLGERVRIREKSTVTCEIERGFSLSMMNCCRTALRVQEPCAKMDRLRSEWLPRPDSVLGASVTALAMRRDGVARRQEIQWLVDFCSDGPTDLVRELCGTVACAVRFGVV